MSDDRLSKRWTEEQKERAYAIVNDIAEDIDNKESRAELRQSLAIYADFICEEREAKQAAHTTEVIEKMSALIKIMETQRLSDLKAGMTIALSFEPTEDMVKFFSPDTDRRASFFLGWSVLQNKIKAKRDSLTEKDLP